MYKSVMSYLKSRYAIISICCILALVIMLGCSWNSDDNDEYIVIDDFSRTTKIESLEQQETLSLSDNSSLKYQADTFDITTRLVFYKKATKQDESSVYGAAVSDVYSVTAYKDVTSSIDLKTRTVPLNSIEKPFELTLVSNTSKPSTNDVYLGIKDYQDKTNTGWEYTKIDDFYMNSDKSVFVYKSGNNYIVSTTKLNSNFAIFTSDEIKQDSNYLGGVKNISLELEPKEYDVVKVIDAKTGKETITYGSDTLVNAIVDVENPSLLDIKDIETVITFISDCPNPIPGGIVVNGNTYHDTVNSINGEPQADAKGNKYTHVIKINDKTISPEGNVFKIKIETKGKSLEEFPANFTVKTIFNVDNGNVRYRTSGEAKAERVQAVNIAANMTKPQPNQNDVSIDSDIVIKFTNAIGWADDDAHKKLVVLSELASATSTIDCTYTYSNDKKTLTIVPKDSLKYSTKYLVEVKEGLMSDKDSLKVDPNQFVFTTMEKQVGKIVATLKTPSTADSVDIKTNIVIKFTDSIAWVDDEAHKKLVMLQKKSATAASDVVCEYAYGDTDRSLTLTASPTLDYSTDYSVVISEGLMGKDAESKVTPITFNFKTVAKTITTVVAEMHEPVNGAIDIPTWYPFEATDKSKSYIRFTFDSEFAWTPEMNSKVTVKKGNDKVDCDVVPEKGSLKLVLQPFAYASTYTVSFASGIVDKNDKQLKPADFSFSTVKELPMLGFRTYFVKDIKMPKDEKNTGLDEAVIVFFVEKINGGKTEIGKYVTLDSVPLGKLESDGIINFDAFTLEDASKIDDIAAKYDATEIANKIKDNIDLVNPNLTLLIMKAKSHWIGGGHNYLFSIKRDYLFNPEKTKTVWETNWEFKTVNNGKPTNQPVISASSLIDGKATLRPDLTVSFGTKISDKDADNIKNLIVVKDESNESVDYNPSWNSGKDALTIKFDEDVLNPDSKYVIHMSSSISADNGDVFNPFEDMSFDTLPAMTVESFAPADNATGFATRGTIVVTFSGDADFTEANVLEGVKINKSGSSENIINDMKIATDSKKLMLTPATGLDVKTTYQITVLSNKLKNLRTGQMVAGEKSSKFTTVAEIKASINFQNQTKCFVGGDKTATVLNPEFDIDFGTNVGDTDATERLIVIDKSGVTVPESKYEKIWKDGNKSVLTIRFKEDLEGEAEYTVKMTGNAEDEKGKTIARMDDFSFTTLPATMTLTAWSPDVASTTDEDDFVESNTNIWLSFQDNKVNLANFTIDEIKNHLSVRNYTEDVALGLTSKFNVATNSERIILTPSGDGMTKDRVFEVTLTTGMKNVYHQTVSTPDRSFRFRTVDQASTIFVSGVTPTDETGKKTPVDTKISISLTDDIDWVVGTSEEKVQLVAPDKSLVACNCSYANRVITLTPIQFLAYETRYQVVVKRGLKKGLERVAPNDENYFTTGSNSIASRIYDKNGVEIVTISNAEGTEYSTTMTVDLDGNFENGNFEIKFDDIINWNKDWESSRIQGYKDIVAKSVKWSDLRFTAGLQYTYPTVSQNIDHLVGRFNEALTYDTTYAIAILKDVTNPETGDSSPRKIFLFHTKGEGIAGSLSSHSGFNSPIAVGVCSSTDDHREHAFYLKFNKPINRSVDYAGSQVFKIYEKGHPENTVTIDMSNVYWTEADKNICIKFNKNGLNAGHKLALPGKTYILEYDSSKALIDSTGEKVNIEKLVTDGKFTKNGDLYQFEFTTTAS